MWVPFTWNVLLELILKKRQCVPIVNSPEMQRFLQNRNISQFSYMNCNTYFRFPSKSTFGKPGTNILGEHSFKCSPSKNVLFAVIFAVKNLTISPITPPPPKKGVSPSYIFFGRWLTSSFNVCNVLETFFHVVLILLTNSPHIEEKTLKLILKLN